MEITQQMVNDMVAKCRVRVRSIVKLLDAVEPGHDLRADYEAAVDCRAWLGLSRMAAVDIGLDQSDEAARDRRRAAAEELPAVARRGLGEACDDLQSSGEQFTRLVGGEG